MKTYVCSICHAINHVARLHCQACGTVPARYSMIGVASNNVGHHAGLVPITVAIGADRQESHRTVRVNLRTVTSDYYAGE